MNRSKGCLSEAFSRHMKSLHTFFLTLLLLMSLGLHAQVPLQLTDIYAGGSTFPHYLVAMENTLYFVTIPGSAKSAVWKSNGIPGGAAALNNDSGDGYIADLSVCNSMLYLDRDDLVHGLEVWISNGTPGNLSMLKDIYPLGGQGGYCYPKLLNGMVYFSANDYIHGSELWKTDGTTAGTAMVKDINPLANHGLVSLEMVVLNNKLFFIGDDGIHGQELWSTDGTESGTQLVADLNPGSNSSSPFGLNVYNGLLYFYAATTATGYEPYVTDGTTAGLLKDIVPGAESSVGSRHFLAFKDKVYFSVLDANHIVAMWETDGTTAGTKEVYKTTGLPYTDFLDEGMYTICKDTLFFLMENSQHHVELWTTDGSAAGTKFVLDANTSKNSASKNVITYRDHVYFMANDGTHGNELWQSDGTPAGTYMIADLYPGNGSSGPDSFCVTDEAFYFTALTSDTSMDIWKLAPPEYVRPKIRYTRVCKGEKTVFETTVLPPVSAYHWEIKESDQLSIRYDNMDSVVHTFVHSGTYAVKLVVDVNGMSDVIKRNDIIVDSLPQDFMKDTFVCANSHPVLQAQPNQLSYLWNTGSTTPQQPVEAGHRYTVQVSNSCGNSTDEAVIKDIHYTVTNLVTPNNDAQNDHLVVDANVALHGNLEIYNSWGLMVYSSQAYNNTWPEKDTEGGVYFYRFAFDTCPPDKGWVQVIK